MTRFARAKGSKASNERLPEPPTSWSEMKQELLNKNKDLEDAKKREKIMEQREVNYQAFLQQKEEEDDKNISWADIPESQIKEKKQKALQTTKKRTLGSDNNDEKNLKSSESSFEKTHFKKMKTSVQQNEDVESEDSNEEFLALKSQIDKVLSNQMADNSDSDAPPEEASTKKKPEEIVIKKAKKPKQKLQILINSADKLSNVTEKTKKELEKKAKQYEEKRSNRKKENLSNKDKKKIEKKQERYKKQLEKKKLKKQENKLENIKIVDDVTENTIISSFSKEREQTSLNLNEIDAKKLEKKLERRKKQKEKKLKRRQEAGLVNNEEDKIKDEVLTEKDLAKIQKKKERRARQAEKRKKLREAKALASENAEKNEKEKSDVSGNANDSLNNLKDNQSKRFDRKTKFQDKNSTNEANLNFTERKPYQKHLDNKKEKKSKLNDKKDFNRNKPKFETMFINGKTVEIDYVDGFPVKKEDADRLKKLRKEMISRGLPRSEINISLKLERRRAEKALAREKKNVCFNCRKSGHNLSECPELDKDQMAQTSGTGICFKCGSTEHTHFECKVVKGLDYKFASCFICKEQGHISRQCPDNQRGLYPKGGACKVCGDVTHLKKDCPKDQTQQAQLQANLSVGTLDNRNPDDLGSQWNSKNSLGPVKKLNKIKF